MSKRASTSLLWAVCGLALALLQACGVKPTPTFVPTGTHYDTLTATSEASTPTPLATRATGALPTAGAEPVSVAAAQGNVFIRRGPNVAFNPISVLRRGQSATAMARDVLGEWLEIRLPADPQKSGWISILTKFTTVSGDVRGLPEIEPTLWPNLAFLRNCTHHEMAAYPGGITIPAVDAFPENEVRMNPGTYSVIDTDVDGYPEVLSVDIWEGAAIEIRVDGLGEKKKCPLR